jgi:serine/threonine-protein kinase
MNPNTTDLIGPPLPSTPAGESGRYRTLPPDLLREASKRVGVMALLGAALWVFGVVGDHLAVRALFPGADWLHLDEDDVIGAVLITISLLLYRYSRKEHGRPELILNLGLGYMVVTAVGIGIIMHWGQIPENAVITPMISWIGVVVVLFSAILPTTRGRLLAAGLVSVSMNPVGMEVQKLLGNWDFGSPGKMLLMHYPDYILVGAAVVVSGVVNRLRQQVARARELGSYQLNELIGRGGMGEVYRATHRMLARPAAIKLIRGDKIVGVNGEPNQLVVKRFRREAETAASLRSPHTVELYDFGVTEDGTLYFVMELLVGLDLETIVKRFGPMPPARVVHVLKQACGSLAEAHATGMVHRDIKPANIHLGQLGLTYDFVKVLDFGLVKAVKEDTTASLETAAGRVPGTPAYMAPEMALGEKIDGRADLYALGCVAYYLLTGKLVFEAENSLQIIAKHIRGEPQRPSQRTNIQLPESLELVVMRCLAKRPDGRPQTALELSDMLEATCMDPWDQKQAAQWWERVLQHQEVAHG